jgi:hypothetical protein
LFVGRLQADSEAAIIHHFRAIDIFLPVEVFGRDVQLELGQGGTAGQHECHSCHSTKAAEATGSRLRVCPAVSEFGFIWFITSFFHGSISLLFVCLLRLTAFVTVKLLVSGL